MFSSCVCVNTGTEVPFLNRYQSPMLGAGVVRLAEGTINKSDQMIKMVLTGLEVSKRCLKAWELVSVGWLK